MTELYRGLLEILVKMGIQQIESLRIHIQSHNSGYSDSQVDFGVTGFWNYMLEIIFTLFSIFFLFIFVLLTATLAVVSYPPAAFINYGSWLVKNTKNPETHITASESPVIIKKEKE